MRGTATESVWFEAEIPAAAVTVVIPSAPEYLRVLRAVVKEVAELDRWSDEDKRALILAVDEACSNIMKHAYRGASDRPIQVSFFLGRDDVRVELIDVGERVDPSKVQPRKVGELRPGGLGVHLIRALMDTATFDTEYARGNRLILTRRITRNDDAEKA